VGSGRSNVKRAAPQHGLTMGLTRNFVTRIFSFRN
jgi:hypothetical protein